MMPETTAVPVAALQLAGGPALGPRGEPPSADARSTYLLQDGCGQFLGQLLLVVPQVSGLVLLVLQRKGREWLWAGEDLGDLAITFRAS